MKIYICIDLVNAANTEVHQISLRQFIMKNLSKISIPYKRLEVKTCAFTKEILSFTSAGIETFGKNAVVCGRSKNVGMPIAMLLHADGMYETKAGLYYPQQF